MNSQKRLGQLEKVMTEMLQKQDRIEDLVTKTFGLAETAYTNGETTARAVASQTIETQKAHQKFDQKLDDVHQKINQELNEVRNDVKEIMNFLREKFS